MLSKELLNKNHSKNNDQGLWYYEELTDEEWYSICGEYWGDYVMYWEFVTVTLHEEDKKC